MYFLSVLWIFSGCEGSGQWRAPEERQGQESESGDLGADNTNDAWWHLQGADTRAVVILVTLLYPGTQAVHNDDWCLQSSKQLLTLLTLDTWAIQLFYLPVEIWSTRLKSSCSFFPKWISLCRRCESEFDMNRKQLTVKIDMTVIWLPERATDALMRDPTLLHILGAVSLILYFLPRIRV